MDIYEEVGTAYHKYAKKKCVIGYSYCEREIYAFHVGKQYGRQFIAVCGMHGREWICARLALKFIRQRTAVGGWIIPLLNPDGATISQTKQPLWKANARGVDLNCNFDADWGTGVSNVTVRGAENCIGDYPLSEPETAALVRFTKQIQPFVTLSFHTKGGEIYWEYGGEGDMRGANILAAHTGYSPRLITGSAGGYKDWCIKSLHIPAYTVECGSDLLAHPITRLKDIRECYGLLTYFFDNYSPDRTGLR